MLRPSRRGFLLASGAATLISANPREPEPVGCSLPESARGYRAVLSCPGIRVLPAASSMNMRAVSELRSFIENGGFVLFESGAGFAEPEIFKRQQALFQSAFSISLLPPIQLWNSTRPPYVEYRWPVCASVRDFSGVVPVEAAAGETIGRLTTMPVAVRREIGAGCLVFLGSPLGPHLLAGDPDACRWFTALQRTAAPRAAPQKYSPGAETI